MKRLYTIQSKNMYPDQFQVSIFRIKISNSFFILIFFFSFKFMLRSQCQFTVSNHCSCKNPLKLTKNAFSPPFFIVEKKIPVTVIKKVNFCRKTFIHLCFTAKNWLNNNMQAKTLQNSTKQLILLKTIEKISNNNNII